MMPARWLLLLILANPFPSTAAPTAAEMAELFMPPQFYRPKLSPNGDYLGFLVRRGDVHAVGVYSFATRKMNFIGGDPKIVPTDFWWKTPSRLLIQTTSEKHDALGYTAADADGRNVEDMWRVNSAQGLLFDGLPSDPHNVLVFSRGEIVKFNVDTGRGTPMSGQMSRADQWVIDELGQLRAGTELDRQIGEITVWWNAAPGGDWHSRTFTNKEKRFYPQAVAVDPRYLLGWEFGPDDDVAISRFDTTTGTVETLDRIADRDPTAILLLGRTRKPIAVSYEQDAAVRLVALADTDAPRIESLEKHFSGYVTRIVDTMPDGKNWLLWVGNSRLPGAYILFNHQTSESYVLALAYDKALAEDRFAPGEYFTFTQRDGIKLSGRLWRPRNAPQPPLVVVCPDRLPSGIVEDIYDPLVQSLVLQGFAVLEVNGRNSWGFGKAGRQLPREKWIGSLQEDLDDAVQVLERQKAVDPTRVSLYGGEFGGVLALQVAARSKLFSAVATLNIPPEVHRDDLFKLTNEPGTNPLVTKLGGWFASEDFARELSPSRLVANLPVRALYLHDEDSIRGRPNDAGREIRSAIKGAKAPAQSDLAFSWSQYPKPPSKLALENAEIALKVGTFFSQTALGPSK